MPIAVAGDAANKIEALYHQDRPLFIGRFRDAQVKALRKIADDHPTDFESEPLAEVVLNKKTTLSHFSTEEKQALLEAARIVDHERLAKKLKVASVFETSSILSNLTSNAPANTAAKDILNDELKKVTKSATDYVKDAFNKDDHGIVQKIAANKDSDPVLFAAKNAWLTAHQTWQTLNEAQKTQKTFLSLYQDELGKLAQGNELTDSQKKALNDPKENPLLARAAQMVTMESAAVEIDRRLQNQKNLLSSLKNTDDILKKIEAALLTLETQQLPSDSKLAVSDLKVAKENLNALKSCLSGISDKAKKLETAINTCKNESHPDVIAAKKALDDANKALYLLLMNGIALENLLKLLPEENMKQIKTIVNDANMICNAKSLDVRFAEAAILIKGDVEGPIFEMERNPLTGSWEKKPMVDKNGKEVSLSEKELQLAMELAADQFRKKHQQYAHLSTEALFEIKRDGRHFEINGSLRISQNGVHGGSLEKELMDNLKQQMKTIQEKRYEDAHALGTAGTPNSPSIQHSDAGNANPDDNNVPPVTITHSAP